MSSEIETFALTAGASFALAYLALFAAKNLVGKSELKINRKTLLDSIVVEKAGIAALSASIVASLVEFGLLSVWTAVSFVLTAVASVFFAKRIELVPPKNEEGVELIWERTLRFARSWAGMNILGFAIGATLTSSRWSGENEFLTVVPPDDEARIYLYGFTAILVASVLLFSYLNRGVLRKLPTASRLRRAVNQVMFVPGLTGLFFALIQTQTRTITLANRYWTFIVLGWMVIAALWVITMVLPGTKAHMAEDKEHFEQIKQLKKKRRKKKSRR